MSPSAVERVVIGRVGAPHGVHGEVRIISLTDFPDRFDNLQEVYVGDELLQIQNMRYQKNFILLTFAGIDTREAAAQRTGQLLRVDRKDAAPLAEGEYYTFDIVGLEVQDLAGKVLGEITHILKTGSNDVYCVRQADGTELLVPALRQVVKEISLEKHRLRVDLAAMAEV